MRVDTPPSGARLPGSLAIGALYRVVGSIPPECDFQRLLEMGLTPGVEFRVTKVAPLGDPVEIDLRGCRICLRRAECASLLFERVA